MSPITTITAPSALTKDVALITSGVFSLQDKQLIFSITNPFQWKVRQVSVQFLQLLPNQPRKVLAQQVVACSPFSSLDDLTLSLVGCFSSAFSKNKQLIENEIHDAASKYILSVYLESDKCDMQLMQEIFRVG